MEKTIQKIIDSVRVEPIMQKNNGGQSCGVMNKPIRLICDELSIIIEVGCYRSSIENNEIAIKMIETAIRELIK